MLHFTPLFLVSSTLRDEFLKPTLKRQKRQKERQLKKKEIKVKRELQSSYLKTYFVIIFHNINFNICSFSILKTPNKLAKGAL